MVSSTACGPGARRSCSISQYVRAQRNLSALCKRVWQKKNRTCAQLSTRPKTYQGLLLCGSLRLRELAPAALRPARARLRTAPRCHAAHCARGARASTQRPTNRTGVVGPHQGAVSPVNRVPLPTPGVRRSCILCAQSELSCAHQICHVRAVLGRAHERPKATMPPQGQPLPCSPRERTRLGRLAIHQKRGCAPPCTGHTLRTACSGACAHEMPSVDARAFTGVSLACDHAARLAPMPRLRRWR